MSRKHELLKRQAAAFLKEKGYNVSFEKFIGSFIVDVLGEKGNEKAVVECGSVSKTKLANLKFYVEKVYHLPYPGQKVKQLSQSDFERALDREIEIRLHDILRINSDFIRRLQRHITKPAKIVIEINPAGGGVISVVNT